MSKPYTTLSIAVLTLLLGLGGGYWLANQATPSDVQDSQDATAQQREPLFYRHPMNPEISSPVPAKDEMGMDYIPVYADDQEGGATDPAGTVKIAPAIVQNIGVRTASVEKQSLSRDVNAVGRVAFNEEYLTRLHPKVEGWIQDLFINKTGEPVKEDTILLSLYSPKLVTTQQEYLLALQSRKSLQNAPFQDIRQGALNLAKTARERLELFDVPDHQIRELEQTGSVLRNLHIHSPTAGIVMNVGVRPGQFVNAQTELYTIADLSQVWVYADIYEYELPWVQVGDKAEMQVQAAPGQTFEGRITYIYPYMDSKTRTIKVRLEFDNPDLVLKPDMYANVSIQADEQLDAVVVPSEAIIRSGTREQVFVQTGPGKFEPREVELGVSSGDMTQILAGVEVDEIVVMSSQFLIDSESKLREAAAKMREVDDDTHQQQGSETSASDSAMEGGGHNHAPSPASETSPGEHKSMEGGGQHDMHSPASETPASDSTMEGGGHNHGQPTGSEEMMEGQHD